MLTRTTWRGIPAQVFVLALTLWRLVELEAGGQGPNVKTRKKYDPKMPASTPNTKPTGNLVKTERLAEPLDDSRP